MFNSILVVCTGNICRSPVAEYLLRHELDAAGRKIEVRSAGIGALVGHPADETAQKVMAEQGLSMQSHQGRQLAVEHVRRADLVLVMESHHLDYVLGFDPTARGKTFLLGHWSKTEIPDPYRRAEAAHRAAYERVQAELKAWLKRI